MDNVVNYIDMIISSPTVAKYLTWKPMLQNLIQTKEEQTFFMFYDQGIVIWKKRIQKHSSSWFFYAFQSKNMPCVFGLLKRNMKRGMQWNHPLWIQWRNQHLIYTFQHELIHYPCVSQAHTKHKQWVRKTLIRLALPRDLIQYIFSFLRKHFSNQNIRVKNEESVSSSF